VTPDVDGLGGIAGRERLGDLLLGVGCSLSAHPPTRRATIAIANVGREKIISRK
jgi:hypothetical protein